MPDYSGLDEEARISLLSEEITDPRTLESPSIEYSETVAGDSKVFTEIAAIHRDFGRQAMPNYIISNCAGISDILEAALLLKEHELLQPGETPAAAHEHHPAVRDHRRPARLRSDHGPPVLDLGVSRPAGIRAT
jgi:phosphoenolpyruvate carboxylase